MTSLSESTFHIACTSGPVKLSYAITLGKFLLRCDVDTFVEQLLGSLQSPVSDQKRHLRPV